MSLRLDEVVSGSYAWERGDDQDLHPPRVTKHTRSYNSSRSTPLSSLPGWRPPSRVSLATLAHGTLRQAPARQLRCFARALYLFKHTLSGRRLIGFQ
jgi:hypothetical protein